jgi:hypothetical protein
MGNGFGVKSRRLTTVVTVALAAGLVGWPAVLPGAADARTRAVAVDGYAAGPTLSQPWVVFAQTTKGRTVLRAAAESGRVKTLGQFERLLSQGRPSERILTVEGAPGRVAVGLSVERLSDSPTGFTTDEPLLGQVITGTIDGPPQRVVRCAEQVRPPGSIGLDGDLLAYLGPGCNEERIAVRDLDRGGDDVRFKSGPFNRLESAGAQVAVEKRFDVTVYDARSGARRFVVDVPTGPDAVDPPYWDIQSDGTIVALVPRPEEGCELRVWGPDGRPRPTLPYDPWCSTGLRVERGTVLFQERLPDRKGRLAAGSLSGAPVRPVSGIGPPSVREGFTPATYRSVYEVGIDFDGDRFAYFEPGCRDARIVYGSLSAGDSPLPLEICLVKLRAKRRVRVDERGRFPVRVVCKRGCHASLAVDDSMGRLIELARPVERTFAPAASGERVLLRLAPAELKALRRAGTRAVTVEASVPQPDGSTRTPRRELTLVAP